MKPVTHTPLDPDRPGVLYVSVAPGSICETYGCTTVHPGCTHAAYDARYDHARTCVACGNTAATHPYNGVHSCSTDDFE